MLNEIISYHRYMVELLLAIAILNIILPFVLKKNLKKMILWTRIGYFAFWMFWAMSAFSGLILFMFTGMALTFSVWVMLVASVFLGLLDGYRAIKIKRLWTQGLDASRFSFLILLIEVFIIISVTVVATKAY
ncbi:MAG: hypothetical protein HF962_04690 [Sulfurovum sp.]|nr:hypothetical protein [Sulfurovum sp.]